MKTLSLLCITTLRLSFSKRILSGDVPTRAISSKPISDVLSVETRSLTFQAPSTMGSVLGVDTQAPPAILNPATIARLFITFFMISNI
ncbi:hypothetical protein D3C80_1750130 [compost metagenome]